MNFLDIFWAQNDCLVIGFLMVTNIFEFWPNLRPWQLFITVMAFWPILPCPFLNPHNLGLEWTFWTFSVLKMIVLSLAI